MTDTAILQTPESKGQRALLIAAIFLCGMLYASFLFLTANHAIIEAHSFRQTQTAISVFYMLKDGLTLNYITPVFGTPWTIPFEAPIYQFSVALFSYVSPFGLDANGRIVSAIYWVGSILLGYKILAHMFDSHKYVPLVFVALALASPLYIFWSRTFMIETTAIFFGLGFLYALMRFTDNGGKLTAALAITSGILCVLTKATTWPSFVIAGGLYFVLKNGSTVLALRPKNITRPENIRLFKRGIILLIGVLLALFIGLSWTAHTDVLKERSLFGQYLTSEFLSQWNFGDISTRMTTAFWNDVIQARVLPDILGSYWWLSIPALAVLVAAGKHVQKWGKAVTVSFICAVIFLLPMLLFTNLHIQHEYYQVANGIFLIAAAAIIIGTLLSAASLKGKIWLRGAALAAMAAIIIGQFQTFAGGYYKLAANPDALTDQPPHQIALLAKQHVSDKGVMLVLGLDWSSYFFYYAERKGVGMPLWVGEQNMKAIAKDPAIIFGDSPIAGFASCVNDPHSKQFPNEHARINAFVADTMTQTPDVWESVTAGYCTLNYRIDL